MKLRRDLEDKGNRRGRGGGKGLLQRETER